MAQTTDTTAAKRPTKPLDKPAEAEPKQRPVKRPAKPAYHVPRGIAWLDGGVTIRALAGAELEDGVIPADLIHAYLKRGDIVAITTH